MSKSKDSSKPKRPTWDDDDASTTVFDDSPLQSAPQRNHLPSPHTTPPPISKIQLPEFESLTKEWRQPLPVPIPSSPNQPPKKYQHTSPMHLAAPDSTDEFEDKTAFAEIILPITPAKPTVDYLTPLPPAPSPSHPPYSLIEAQYTNTTEDPLNLPNHQPSSNPAPPPDIQEDETPTDPGLLNNAKAAPLIPATPAPTPVPLSTPPSHPPMSSTPGAHSLSFPSGSVAQIPSMHPYTEGYIHPTRTSAPQTPFPGNAQKTTERYKTLKPIAKGGMSLISRVFDKHLLRQNAMKILDPQLAQESVHIQRFLEEAQITGQLEHPNIIPIHDIGVGNAGQHYFTMKLVQGQTFKEYLQEHPIDFSSETDIYRILQIFLRICDAVSYAHSCGVLHRDLKPTNVMVGSHGQVYVMDWGIACVLPGYGKGEQFETEHPIQLQRDTRFTTAEIEGDIVGTWNYMAPEQALGQTEMLGYHTDVFALGAVLYEILTGHPPYQHDNIYAMLQHAQQCIFTPPQERVPHLHLPQGLCQIAMKAMQKEPQDRYSTVEQLQEAIETFLRGGNQLPHRHYNPGDLIIREGDEGQEAFVISRGYCQVFKMIEGRKVVLRQMGPGEVFGETSIFLSQRRTASVEAIEPVTLVVVARDTLEQRLSHDTWLGRFVQTLANRFVDVDQKATALQNELEKAQLANTILHYLHIHGVPTSQGKIAPWYPIAEQLCHQFSRAYEDLIQLIQQIQHFQLDLHNDQIALLFHY